MLVHVDDERVDRVAVQDEMREGITPGVCQFRGRHLHLEHLAADVTRGFEAQWLHDGGLRHGSRLCFDHGESFEHHD